MRESSREIFKGSRDIWRLLRCDVDLNTDGPTSIRRAQFWAVAAHKAATYFPGSCGLNP